MTVVICIVTLGAAVSASAGPPVGLPALTRTASRLSGLAPRRRVRVVRLTPAAMKAEATRLLDRDYPSDRQAYDETLYAQLGLLASGESLRPLLIRESAEHAAGLYDPVARTLYVRRGKTPRQALVHELVHALQDQTFNLRRLTTLRSENRDAAAAASAAVEGEAVLATGGYRTRALATSPLATFITLEHDFPFGSGMRLMAALHNLGGNRAMFSALRTFPQTTEQVFHLEAFLTRERAVPVELPATVGGLALSRSDTFGELDVRALLATFDVQGLGQAAAGWGGGRTAIYGDGTTTATTVALSWDTETDAREWAAVVPAYVAAAFPAVAAATCPGAACWSAAGRSIAFAHERSRTALAFAPTVATAADLARAVVSKG